MTNVVQKTVAQNLIANGASQDAKIQKNQQESMLQCSQRKKSALSVVIRVMIVVIHAMIADAMIAANLIAVIHAIVVIHVITVAALVVPVVESTLEMSFLEGIQS